MAVFVSAHSLTTKQLRAALVQHRQAVRGDLPHHPKLGETPRSITAEDSREAKGGAFVAVEGPEAWHFHSVGLTPTQAIAVATAIEKAE